MKRNLRLQRAALALGLGLALPASLPAALVGQWDFNNSNLVATVGQNLLYRDGDGGATSQGTQFGTTASLGLPSINGTHAVVMKFPASDMSLAMGYFIIAPDSASGGGSLVNSYTLVLDVLFPAESSGKIRPILETDQQFLTQEADLIVDAGNGIGGVPGPYHGTIAANTWYRLGFVVDGPANVIRKYINGVEVGTQPLGGVDSKFALQPGGYHILFANTTAATAAVGYVNSLQLRDVALNAGQMSALGGPSADGIPQTIPSVPSFVQSRSPGAGATGVGPQPAITVVLNQGDNAITGGSIQLALDGVNLATGVAATPPTYTAMATTAILDPNSTHTLRVTWQDSVTGNNTNTWSFTVANYQNVTLPPPFYFENFDGVAEGALPAGWTATNNTTTDVAGYDLNNVRSDAYKDWVVISSNRAAGLNFDGTLRLTNPPIVVNGTLLKALISGNFAYAESDVRSGTQVQMMFTHNISCTGRSNVWVAWNSSYAQNQDNIAAVEYSVNGGATWLPVIYYLDDQNQAADIIRTNGVIDVGATFGTGRGDQAYGQAYSNFIGAPVSTALIPFIAGRINDNHLDGKRVELVRLPQADNAATVKLRFMQAGTASWYFGVDDVGLYEVNTPVILTQPQNRTINATESTTFTVAASSSTPLTYRWQRNGVYLTEGGHYSGVNTATLTVSNAEPEDAGAYRCVVANNSGPVNSALATLTVIDAPLITAQPVSVLVSAGYPASFSVSAMGRPPLRYHWKHDGTPVGGDANPLTLASTVVGDAGQYLVVVSNVTGLATSAVAVLTVIAGPITSDLVVHLKFDGDYNDASGRNNHALAMGSPGFGTGKFGQAFRYTNARDGSSFNYATLGYPADLMFGDSTDFTVAYWSKIAPGSKVGDPPAISNKNWDSGGNVGWVCGVQGNNNFEWNYREAAPNTRKDFDSTVDMTDDQWHHVVVTFQRGFVARTFLDGVLVDSRSIATAGTPPTTIDTPLAVNIGQDGRGTYTDGGSVGITNGLIDDVGLWRRALTPQEAVAIYNASFNGKHLAQAAVGDPVPVPQITTPPANLTVSDGGPASFAVTATGPQPITYQWWFGNAAIGGATNRTYALAAAYSTNAGNYKVVVSNPGGSVTSSVATLTVVSLPVISAHPQSRTNNQNLDVAFSVTASGGALEYQWKHAGADLPGATTSALYLASIVPAQGGAYTVEVKNPSGAVLSDPAQLTVLPMPPVRLTGQWDFDNGLAASCGRDLEFFDATVQADTTFGTTTSFGIGAINGVPANVLRFVPSVDAWGGYKMVHQAAPNGGGLYVNQYTLVFDVYYPTASSGRWRSFFQSNTGNANDGDFFVNTANGIGTSGNYQGNVTPNAWHRIAFAVDLSGPLGPVVAKWLDGVKVGYQTLGAGLDGRWSLDPFALLFADEDGDQAETYVSSVQFWNGKLPDALLLAMGAPTASKLPGCIAVRRAGAYVQVSRTGGLGLEQADSVTGPWTEIVGAPNPYLAPIAGSAKYYRPKF